MANQSLDQYNGFLNTPNLWTDSSILELNQFTHSSPLNSNVNLPSELNTRLGKRIEQFVFQLFNSIESIQVIDENIQIQKNRITLGEIDCLLRNSDELIHLEIVYKFYLYDSNVSSTELERWIGPNRKDSLIEKLKKLKIKQLPLLYKEETKMHLQKLKLDPEDFKQKVYFKAQLFIPLSSTEESFSLVNNNCIYGFYARLNELTGYSDCVFSIPSKLDWVSDVSENVKWQDYSSFLEVVGVILKEKRSPMCWLKQPNGTFQKFFVVWWDEF
jgi:hypothetical protein